MPTFEFELNEPYALGETLASGQAFRWRQGEGGYLGLIGSQPVQLSQREDSIVARTGPGPDGSEAIARYLRISDPLGAIYAEIAKDPPMAKAVARWRGLHLLAQDPWETTASFIASSASNIARISRTVEALSHRFGERVETHGWSGNAFPSATALSRAPTGALLACGLGYRAAYLKSTARAVDAGDLDLEALRAMSTDDARQALVETLDGVGPKVADCILLFSLGKDDTFPVDRWVQRQVGELYLGGKLLPPAQVAAWGRDRFGPWAGYAQQYLFQGGRADRAKGTPAARSRRLPRAPSSGRSSSPRRPARGRRARNGR